MRCLLTFALLASACLAADTPKPAWNELKYRTIGPFRGGRVTAVAGVPAASATSITSALPAAASGRPRTAATPGCRSRTNSSRPAASAPSASLPRTRTCSTSAWAKSPIRGNVSHGDGMYKSVDGGKTWKHVGPQRLAPHCARARPSQEPRRRLGGRRSATSSAPTKSAASSRPPTAARPGSACSTSHRKPAPSILSSIPRTRKCLYAGFWEVRRSPWSLESGGPGERHLEVDRRRRHLDRPDQEHRTAQDDSRQDRHHRLAGQSGARLGHRRSRG